MLTPDTLMPDTLTPDAATPGAPTPGAAGRALALGAGGATEVLAAARALEAAGRHVVHLEVGEPDAPTPPHVVEAGVRALRDGLTRYGPPAGIPEFRAAAADALRARGIPAEAARVVVAPGAKAMIFTALLAAVRPGDDVLVPDPGYPAYAAVAEFAGGRAVRYPVRAAGGGQAPTVDADEVAARLTPRARVLVLNAPHNPTGGVLATAALERLAELATARGLLVLSDEIYARHLYADAPAGGAAGAPSIAALPGMAERTVVVDGLSKTYAMTGWRLGYGLLPAALAAPVTALLANSASCTATFVQHAGVAALTGPQDGVAAQAAEFRRRRDRLVAALDGVDGVSCATPGGAFYVFPDVTGVLARAGLTTEAFARRLLERHGLACVPGTAFGPGGAGHLRLAYTASPGDLALAAERFRAGAAEAAG
jgi:aspartate/methionine/tyrosine aminotransferase